MHLVPLICPNGHQGLVPMDLNWKAWETGYWEETLVPHPSQPKKVRISSAPPQINWVIEGFEDTYRDGYDSPRRIGLVVYCAYCERDIGLNAESVNEFFFNPWDQGLALNILGAIFEQLNNPIAWETINDSNYGPLVDVLTANGVKPKKEGRLIDAKE